MTTTELLDQVGIHLDRYKALATLIDSRTDPDQVLNILTGLNEHLEQLLDTASNRMASQP